MSTALLLAADGPSSLLDWFTDESTRLRSGAIPGTGSGWRWLPAAVRP